MYGNMLLIKKYFDSYKSPHASIVSGATWYRRNFVLLKVLIKPPHLPLFIFSDQMKASSHLHQLPVHVGQELLTVP
jgi:hypothetical protein